MNEINNEQLEYFFSLCLNRGLENVSEFEIHYHTNKRDKIVGCWYEIDVGIVEINLWRHNTGFQLIEYMSVSRKNDNGWREGNLSEEQLQRFSVPINKNIELNNLAERFLENEVCH